MRSPTTASSHHQHLGISSQQGLELTVTETAAEAAGLLAHAFQGVPEVFERPVGLARALRGACGASSSLSAACWLHNLTGAAVELWVASPAEVQAGQLLQGGCWVRRLCVRSKGAPRGQGVVDSGLYGQPMGQPGLPSQRGWHPADKPHMRSDA